MKNFDNFLIFTLKSGGKVTIFRAFEIKTFFLPDSMSVVNDLERFFPRTKKCLNQNIRPQPNQVPPLSCNNLNLDKGK